MLDPISFEQQLTGAEVTFVQGIADHTYTDGQLIIGNGSTGGVSIATLTAGSGMTITNGHGTITLTASGGAATSITVGTTAVDTGTDKYVLYDNAGTLGAYAVSGSGNVAMTTSPSFTTPTLGVASATSINKLTITAPATGSTLTIADGKTLTVSNTLTFTGTDSSSVVFGTGGTVVYTTVTSLSSLATVGTIGTGTWQATTIGLAYGGTNANLSTTGGTSQVLKQTSTGAAITVAQLAASDLSNGTTGSGSVVLATSPSLTTPTLGVASATTINKVTLTAPATGSTLTIADGKTLTASNTMTLAAGADGQTWTFPSSSDTVVTLGAAQTLTSKTLTTPVINGTSTGTGVSATPTASIIAMWDANKNLSANNFIDGFTTTATAGATTTLTVSSTGIQVFTGSTTQTVTLPTTSIVAGAQYVVINNSTGAVTVQSSGANTITILAASTSAVFTAVVATPTTAANWNSQYLATVVTSGKKLSVSNTLTLAGTDATTMTFPGASDTVGGLGTAQTWTAQNKFNNIVDVNNAITASGNAATVPVTYRLSTVTNNSAATLTITMTTASAVDGQMTIVRILDFSAVAQTITWVNTENSTVSAPTTSNGSTTLPLTVGFMYNAGTSKWRCIASA